MVPSSRFASSLKPNVAYLLLNFCAVWKKQTTLPPLAYAGSPYQVLGERAGALALMMAWIRPAMARSGSGISAIFASTSVSPSARLAAAFSSLVRSFIVARSSAVNPLKLLSLAVALCVAFFAGFLSAIANHLFVLNESHPLDLLDADHVARGIAERAVADAVRLIGRLLDHFGAAGFYLREGVVVVGGGPG